MRLRWASAPLAAAVLIGWAGFRWWPRRLDLTPARTLVPLVSLTASGASVQTPARNLVADVATFEDEIFAYLMFGYLRGPVVRDGGSAWLTYERCGKSISYVVRLAAGNDLLTALPYFYKLTAMGAIAQVSYRWVIGPVVSKYAYQSMIFDQAYNLAPRRKLEHLSRAELIAYTRRFIRFKAVTDGRIRRRVEPVPHPPNGPEAHQLAEDIVTVADFYGLPLEFFLGIGAMENNYLNVKGDIGNAVWKRRRHEGDVVLKHGKRGVLVLNESAGIWQITRETLRYAHRLYLRDRRGYLQLPEHLRPPRDINLNDVPPEILTTYAGLFFRDLLDRFGGDVNRAVGAYNGGPGNPNLRYEAGVRSVAGHARRVLEHAAALQGRPAAGMQFLVPGRFE